MQCLPILWLKTYSKSSAGYLARTHATRAYRNRCGSSVNDSFDLTNIGLPSSVSLAVGVGNVLTKGNALSANATFCHYRHLLIAFMIEIEILNSSNADNYST